MTSQLVQRQVTLSHGTTNYWECGTGEPVILLHGVGFWTGGDYWAQNMEALGESYHVYAPDFVGWGTGDRLDVEYSFAYLVDFVREFQDTLGISSAHIIGHSMGGWVASLFGYESPNRVRTLTLVASGGMSTRTLSTMTTFEAPAYEDIMRHALATIEGAQESTVTDAVDRWYQRTKHPGALDSYRKILSHMNNPVHRARYNLLRRLPQVKLRTLIVWGSEDNVNPLNMGEQMHELIDGSEFVVLPCGHYIPSEAPQAFNQEVLHFLRKNSQNGDVIDDHRKQVNHSR
ncbi:alpha/beta fold hydrolase [Alicyclobacillus dauci]|uniref:Alpha/beta fold hydrolase n=1 Tax=Alicyclobacillus dauci TaxID=1475485 RepID=A0ABY6YZF8_9BACL|nr:alpha/beta fold hydrolase [Alicyclobacillus dauci]WAH35698.1 alpha/beta fold hydrolase [Alicyclobacillus dauci]